MDVEKRWDLLWRGATFVASVVGAIWLLAMLLGGLGGVAPLLAIVPLLTGFACALAPMEPQTRILLLWVAAALLSVMAVLTIFVGIGLLFLFIVAAYVMAAWMLNEAAAAPE